MRSRPATILGWIVGCAIVLGVWAFFAPAKLGGSTSYTITSGISMQPLLRKNDLAFVRTQTSYHVGEVVLYQSPVLHEPVLHRIILVQHGDYFFKGDNNGFVDPGYATRSELVGSLWFSVPKAGGVLAWFGLRLHAALVAGFAALLVVLTRITPTRRSRRRRRSPAMIPKHKVTTSNRGRPGTAAVGSHESDRRPPAFLEGPTWSLASLGVAVLLALVLLAVGFGAPLHRIAAQPDAYRQAGTFSYSAAVKAPNSVYPSGIVTTGQPIYPSLVDAVTLRFGYHFESALPHHVRGTVVLRALLLSRTDTWREVSTVVPITKFTGDNTAISSELRLSALYGLIGDVAAQSGIAGSNYSVDIQPVVHVVGTVGGTSINDTFSPVLPFAVTQTAIRIDVPVAPPPPGATYVPSSASAALASTLGPVQRGHVPHVVANAISVARYKLSIPVTRWFGIVLAALALMLAALHDRLRRRQAKRSIEERIARQLGALIVPVASLARRGTEPIDVPDFADLAGLARFLERPILYEVREGRRVFAVDDDTRRYVTAGTDRRQGRARDDGTAGNSSAHLMRAASVPPARRRPVHTTLARGGAVVLVLVVSATLTMSFTASTTVPVSRVASVVQPGAVVQAAPAACTALSLTSLVIGSGTFSSGSSHALILGTAGVDRITASGGYNCIIGGAGKDTVNSTSTSVCIIGPTGGTRYVKCTAHT